MSFSTITSDGFYFKGMYRFQQFRNNLTIHAHFKKLKEPTTEDAQTNSGNNGKGNKKSKKPKKNE